MINNGEKIPEPKVMQENLGILAGLLEHGDIEGVSPEVLMNLDVDPAVAREVFEYLESHGAIGAEISPQEGYAIDRARLQELIDNTSEAPVKPAEETQQESRILEAREKFSEEVESIKREGLVADVILGEEFDNVDLQKVFFDHGPEEIQRIVQNLKECLRAVHADLHEFIVEILADNSVRAWPKSDLLGIGVLALDHLAFPDAIRRLNEETAEIAMQQEAERKQKEDAVEDQNFAREEEYIAARVAGLDIDPKVRRDIIETKATTWFFASLKTLLGMNLNAEGNTLDLTGRKVFILEEGNGVHVSPKEISVGFYALGDGVVEERAREIREKVNPPRRQPNPTRAERSKAKQAAPRARASTQPPESLVENIPPSPEIASTATNPAPAEPVLRVMDSASPENPEPEVPGRSPEPEPPATPDAPALPPNLEISPEAGKALGDRIEKLISQCHQEGASESVMELLYDLAGFSYDAWPSLLARAEALYLRHELSLRVFSTFSDIAERGVAINHPTPIAREPERPQPSPAPWPEPEPAPQNPQPPQSPRPSPNPTPHPPVSPAPAPALQQSPRPETVEMPLDLNAARQAYADAYAKYLRENSGRRDQTFGIGGNTFAVETARDQYDAALKAAAEKMRDKAVKERTLDTEMHRYLFEEFVVNEEKRLADLRVGEMPPKEQGRFQKIWLAYARLPRWQRIAASAVLGTSVAFASGTVAGVGLLLYAGRRIVSPLVSGGAGALATLGIESYDQTLGRKGTKEYQLKQLLKQRQEDISQNLVVFREQYKTILKQQANREKKRTYLKIGIAALAGGLTSFATGSLEHHISSAASVASPAVEHPVGQHHDVPAPKAAPHEEAVQPARPSPLGQQPTPDSAAAHVTPPDQPAEHPSAAAPTETAPHENPAGSASPETPPTPTAPVAEHVPSVEHVVEIKSGDSLWRVTANELKDNPDFDKLNEAQKTWVLSTLTNRAIEHHDQVGFQNADALQPTAKLNLSEILKNDDVKNLVDKAHELTEAQQANILNNNHAIVEWLKEHPGKPLTSSQVEDILKSKPAGAPVAVEQQVENPVPVQPESELTPHVLPDNPEVHPTADVPVEHTEISGANVPDGHAPSPTFEAPHTPLSPEVIRDSIRDWQVGNIAEASKIANEVQDMSRFSPPDRLALVASLASKVGDKHFPVDVSDAAAVSRQVKDYLVAYPEAQQLGFHNYEEYAGMKDIALGKLMSQLPSAEQGDLWPSALRHTFFHRGLHVEELRNGKLHKIPVTLEHARLGIVLELTTDSKDSAKTVGQVLIERSEEIARRSPEAINSLRSILLAGGK